VPPPVVRADFLARLTVHVEVGGVLALADAESGGRGVHDGHLGSEFDGGR